MNGMYWPILLKKSLEGPPVYEGELSQGLCYLPAKAEHFFLANLINERFEYERALPDLYEPVLVVLGHSVLVLIIRGFERIGEGDCLLLGGLAWFSWHGVVPSRIQVPLWKSAF